MPAHSDSGGFRPRDLATFVDVLAADLHPATGTVVYAANTSDKSAALERSVLWLRGPHGESRVLAPSSASQLAPAISPDGATTAFHESAFHESVGQVYQLRTVTHATGHTAVLTDYDRGTFPVQPAWSPQGDQLAFVASAEPVRNVKAPYRVERPLWRMDGLGLIDDVKGEIWITDASGDNPRAMTAHDAVILKTEWSHSGEHLLYSTIAHPDSNEYALRVLNVVTGESTVVLEGLFIGYPPVASWLPDGRIIYATPWVINNARDLHVYDPARSTHVALNIDFDGQLFGGLEPGMSSSILGSRIVVDDGTNAYVAVQRGGQVNTVKVPLDAPASASVVASFTGSTYPLAWGNGTLLVARMSISAPIELHLHDERGTRRTDEERRVTDFDRSRQQHAPFTAHHLPFTSDDGVEVDAWFLQPLTGAAPYPTVVRLHGGPFAGVGQVYSVDDAVLTSAGYGVLLINFRGSSGYGEEFAAPLEGAWGTQDAADVLAGMRASISRGWVDRDRTAAFGLSGGGFLVSWLLTHSNDFATGITECGISDWNSMFGSDIHEAVTLWMGGRPGNGPESMEPYIRASPLTYAASCTTPLLIIEHESDLRCPPDQGDILYNALKQAGSEVEMLRMPGMSHGGVFEIGDLSSRIARSTEILDWLDRHL